MALGGGSMRWKPLLRSMGLVVGLGTAGTAGAQEINAIDLEAALASRDRPTGYWPSVTDNRATLKRPLDYLTGGMPDRLVYFGGVDASKWSIGGYGGVQWMPNGVNRSGFIMRMFLSESLERYTDGRNKYDTQISRAYLAPGYMFRIGRLETQLLIGPDAEVDLFFRNGRSRSWRTRIGIRGIMDSWWEPTRDLMLQTTLSATTIDSGYNTRIAAGWRLFDSFWIGPEAAFSSDFFSQQTRLGAHLTGLRVNDYEWTFAAGRVTDNFGREGVYGRVGVMLRQSRAPFFDN